MTGVVFSILFFLLLPGNRHPLILSCVSSIQPITATYTGADWRDGVHGLPRSMLTLLLRQIKLCRSTPKLRQGYVANSTVTKNNFPQRSYCAEI